jgi:hypothetical protein
MNGIVGIHDWPGVKWITPIGTTPVAWLLYGPGAVISGSLLY